MKSDMPVVESSVKFGNFIPPRKRNATKKANGVQNYVDHIVTVQVFIR